MSTRFRFMREWSSLQGGEKKRVRPASAQPTPTPTPGHVWHTPDAVVHDHGLLGGAGDGIVMLEETKVATRICQHGIVRQRVLAVHAGVAGVAHRQAEQDLCTPASEKRTSMKHPRNARPSPPPPPGAGGSPTHTAPPARSPELGLQHAPHALVKGPGCVVARPVVILSVRVGEKVTAEHGEAGGVHARDDAHPLVKGIEVI